MLLTVLERLRSRREGFMIEIKSWKKKCFLESKHSSLFCFGFSKSHQLLCSYLSNRNRQTQAVFNWQPKLCILFAYLSSSARGMKIEAIQFVRVEFCVTAFQGSNAEILSRETCLFLRHSEAAVSKPCHLNGCSSRWWGGKRALNLNIL